MAILYPSSLLYLVIQEEPMEPDMNMEHPMEGPSLAPPQLKEEPMENWQVRTLR
ncbi:unnamed protein product [Plutella xylostella]|uniref:(diamondback moth) hypothetical protein n=1 Tax=Plutella xylostella TaxID=51655 RepID=A0A8S4D6V9_PLUXY|nr:unnamed protein product [Plutella xylostella]